MASSIQFVGVEAVVTAFENIKCTAWAIAQGGQFMFKNAGNTAEDATNELRAMLEAIAESSTNALYTLRVYEGIKDRSKIKNTTPYDYSFNFKLNGENQLITNSQYARHDGINALRSEVAALKARLEEEEEEEEEDPTQKTLGQIGDLMSNPVVMQLASMLFGTKMPVQSSPGSLAGTQPGEQESKIQAAIITLKQHDNRLGDHLAKLATIAETKKESFNFLLQTLDSM